jgi:surface carbohydrate biosynthesis protein
MEMKSNSVDVLIFHGENSHLVERLIGSRKFQIFRPEHDLRFKYFFSLDSLINFITIFLKEKNFKVALVVGYIKYLAPKIVITYIDNSYLYQRAAYYLHNKIPFLAIQNGTRLLERDHSGHKKKLFHDYLFVIGEYDVEQYKNFNYHVNFFLPVGSLRNAFYINDLGNFADKNSEYDVCVVSQVRPSLQKNFPEQYLAFEKLISFLNRYQLENNIKICVALRRQKEDSDYKWECEWYESRIQNLKFIENRQKEYSTYLACDRSAVTVGLHSTALRESYGRGNKILSCNFSNFHEYNFPVEDDVSLNIFDYKEFSKRLDYLIKVDCDTFINKHKKNINKMMFKGDSAADNLIISQINLFL